MRKGHFNGAIGRTGSGPRREGKFCRQIRCLWDDVMTDQGIGRWVIWLSHGEPKRKRAHNATDYDLQSRML